MNAVKKESLGGPIQTTVVDQVALLPDAGLVKLNEKSASVNNSARIYIVQGGDTLSDIAELFDVSTDTIVAENNLVNRTVQTDQELKLLPFSGIRHRIKEGDTLKQLSDKYDVEVGSIKAFNPVDQTENLVAGNTLDIPGGSLPKKKKVISPKKSTSAVTSATASRPVAAGWLVHPLRGAGVRTQGIHGMNAVDYGAAIGTPIVASANGTVSEAASGGWNRGYGGYAFIQHDNGATTVYGHMSSMIVNPGQWVAQGQVIGYVGNTGRSTGPHLHFEVRGGFNNPF